MAFVNEFVSEEDIRKHDLDALWGKHKGWDTGRPLGFRHAWTVDRERGIWFIPFDTGREEFTNRRTCFFKVDDQLFEVTIELAEGSTGRLDAVPFKQVWNLTRIRPDATEPRRQKLITALKEALKSYGYEGAKGQVPNTVVEVNF
jgi:hypothetical protein